MYVWMEISQDEYELPLAIAENAQELAKKCGASLSTVKSSASRAKHGKQDHGFCRFLQVELEEG